MTKQVTPSLGLDSYSCPHCGALSHQYWRRVLIADFDDKQRLRVLDPADIDPKAIERIKDEDLKKRELAFLERFKKNPVTFLIHSHNQYTATEVVNMAIARCHSCGGHSVWTLGKLIYPDSDTLHVPNEDMPADVKADFMEAAKVFGVSARGAAALLRLAIQRLMPHLGEKGKNINEDIGSLVKKGLDPVVQQALDVVRVIGNNAVHPGQIAIDDNPESAAKLFSLVNIIVQTMITTRKQISEMFDDLPPTAKAQIEHRDKPKALATPGPTSKDGSEPA